MSGAAGPSILLFVLLFICDIAWAGNTTCASPQLDWYTGVVGETPCETYQKLRRICNPDYKVPMMATPPPGDRCDDQFDHCCCNIVSFQLSMLCINCQHDVDGPTAGIDAPPMTYQKYLHHQGHSCQTQPDNGFSADTQAAVCHLDVRLDDFLYHGWDDGAWFYVWTKESVGEHHAANANNTFTHCSSPSSLSLSGPEATTFTSSSRQAGSDAPQPTDSSPANGSNQDAAHAKGVPSAGAIAGIVVSVIALISILTLGLWYMRRHRRHSQLASRPYRWNASRTHMASVDVTPRPYALPRPPPSSVSTFTDVNSPAPLLTFSSEAMVANRRPAPYSPGAIPSRPSQPRAVRDTPSRVSREDSRVNEPMDDSPDPQMPLEPLRLEEKGPW